DRVAKAVNNAAKQALADTCFNNRASPLDSIAFTNVADGTENHDTDVVGFKVEGQPLDAAREFDHLAGLDIVQAVHAGHAVTDGKHLTNLRDLSLRVKPRNLLFKNFGNFCGADVHHPTPFIAN